MFFIIRKNVCIIRKQALPQFAALTGHSTLAGMHAYSMAEPEVTYLFFTSLSAKNKTYLCDFHKLAYGDGNISYRVVLQTINRKNITADIIFSAEAGWKIVQCSEPIDAGLQWKLITILADKKLR